MGLPRGTGWRRDAWVRCRLNGELLAVSCGTLLVAEWPSRHKKQLRCRVCVWFPGAGEPVVGEHVGDDHAFDLALEALNVKLAAMDLDLPVVGNLPGSATGMKAGRVFRRYQGRECLLIDPVPVEEWLAGGSCEE